MIKNGFMKIRQGFLNILSEKHNFSDTVLLSLDESQAFDRIEWHFLFNVLPQFQMC